MHCVQLTALHRLEPAERPEPVIAAPDQVLLQVEAVGVCGSDVHYYHTGRIGSQVVRFPFVLGHEVAGRVLAVGAQVRRVRPGDRVAVDPAMWCGQCDQCRQGRHHTCRSLRFLGCPEQAEGCLCQRLVMPETSLFPVRPGTTAIQAALGEPLSIGCYAVKLAQLPAGARIAILGGGPIGLSVLLAARVAKAEIVAVSEPIPVRRAVAERAGATWTGTPDQVASLKSQYPLGFHAVFECCGQQTAVEQAVDLLTPGGRLMMVGIPEVDRIWLPIDQARRREVQFCNVRRQNGCAQTALDLIEVQGIDVGFMATHRFPLARTAEAFALVAGYRDGVVKAMIEVE